jgi:hypothetical protein
MSSDKKRRNAISARPGQRMLPASILPDMNDDEWFMKSKPRARRNAVSGRPVQRMLPASILPDMNDFDVLTLKSAKPPTRRNAVSSAASNFVFHKNANVSEIEKYMKSLIVSSLSPENKNERRTAKTQPMQKPKGGSSSKSKKNACK